MTRTHTVALIAALDTKADDAEFVRRRIEASGILVRLIDFGVVSDTTVPCDHTAEEVAALGGTSLETLRAGRDRSAAVAAMAEGARRLVASLHESGKIDGVFALGGGAGTTVGSTAMRDLPLGVPKVILSTIAAGDTSNYLGTSDIVLFPSIVDVAGVNSISRLTYAAAADAMVGMIGGLDARAGGQGDRRPLVAASMFGVTTPAVLRAKERLEDRGCEVVIFHATGAGGRIMERLCAEGHFAAVLDLTTTEWADETVGGILAAGPDRLCAAARAGLPQVVSVGATDMVNFGRPDSVPAEFTARTFYEHNAENTLMRTSVEEAVRIGRNIGVRVNKATAPTIVLVPEGGVSALDAPGQPFEDPLARDALTGALIAELDSPNVQVLRTPLHINAPEFADLAAKQLHGLMTTNSQKKRGNT